MIKYCLNCKHRDEYWFHPDDYCYACVKSDDPILWELDSKLKDQDTI